MSLQNLLKNVKRPESSSPLDLSAGAVPPKRQRNKTPSTSSSPSCNNPPPVPRRSESESPKLHEDISSWSVDDVCNFISSIDICAEYAQVSTYLILISSCTRSVRKFNATLNFLILLNGRSYDSRNPPD